MYVGTGSSDDPDNASGLAHLVEHMMYRSNSNFTQDELSKVTTDKDIGFFSYTTYDCTVHNLGCTSNDLPFALYMLFSALCKQLFLTNEFVVAKHNLCNEIKSVSSNSFNRLYFKLLQSLSKKSKYPCLYRNPCGEVNQVNNITIEDVVKWYKSNYVSSNMILTIVGNFDIDMIHKQVEELCTEYVRAGTKIPTTHVNVLFSNHDNANEDTDRKESRIVLGWNIGESDLNYRLLAADEIVETILFNGDGSRFKMHLKDLDCIDVGGHICRTRDAGWVVFGGGVLDNKNLDGLHTRMHKFVESLSTLNTCGKSFVEHVDKTRHTLIEQMREKLSNIDEILEYLPKLYAMGSTDLSIMNDMCNVTSDDVADVIHIMQHPYETTKLS
jgi:predicted Zn-dependent peptidase